MAASGPIVRGASHAGSWYAARKADLAGQLGGFLGKAGKGDEISAPHAGYSYSGATAAWAYRHLSAAIASGKVARIFVLGPSHHVYLDSCALPVTVAAATPVGSLRIDTDTVSKLAATGKFSVMDVQTDEAEHSIEMQLPYIAQVLQGKDIPVVPIMVGSVSPAVEKEYGGILAPYLQDAANFFVISSDFCHWGERFGFQPHNKRCGEIWQSIEVMDHDGMRLIESQDLDGFRKYLKKTRNTICGRHPINVLLEMITQSPKLEFHIQFVRYAQSSHCKRASDSSVSYASAVVTLPPAKARTAAAAAAGAGAGAGAGGS